MLDVVGVVGLGDGRDFLVEHEGVADVRAGVEPDRLRRAVEVARLPVPLLPLALVRRQLDRVARREVEGLVAVQEGLDGVLARFEVGQALGGVAEDVRAKDGAVAQRHRLDVQAEKLDRLQAGADLEPRLRRVALGDEEEQTSVEGLGGPAAVEGDGDGEAVGCLTPDVRGRQCEQDEEAAEGRAERGHGRGGWVAVALLITDSPPRKQAVRALSASKRRTSERDKTTRALR